ncbi:unnamed protein product [Kuraishia capsulata CBS 1993]|uniref:Mitochondrial presequence protease n=1 Tax=Kuraishia capsulata CBS 1993 TaxID=1382522 RepID=W6MPM8_9ASCO|nr:uncharacterized protein KUCA_T00004564001 [Kuraishia capsulata CBS 1993]CDK28581.1 unnamed protein product [Kuraishia capsulata CBS 1993]
MLKGLIWGRSSFGSLRNFSMFEKIFDGAGAASGLSKQTSFKVDYAPTSITKWRSSRTGLQVTYINQASPIVNGYFAVATEIHNDSGCPHTLEHLIFMGSKKYPYKGLLDVLGNLAYSSTNAWTGTDQTVYTLTTAGWDGFKMLLPIYLDHVLNPTLTDDACYTEVYHIDGEAKEKGVVFSEMQAIETSSSFLATLASQRALYKKSGYRSETGGLTENLRTLTNDDIRHYHKSMYRPDNLCIILTGSVDEDELISIMEKFDNELPPISTIPQKRPFIESPVDLPPSSSITETVEFPDKDESSGEILLAWIGPDGMDLLMNQAVDVLGEYLTNSSIALLRKAFVEIENPLAVSVEYYTDDFVRTGLNLYFSSVPTEKLADLSQSVLSLLKEHTAPEKFDLVRVRDVLDQMKLKFIYSAEVNPDIFSNIAISEFLYGNVDGSDLPKLAKDLKELDELYNWTAEQWCAALNEYFVENKCAILLGKPSEKLYKTLKKTNKELLKERKEVNGKEGLERLKKRLEQAQKMNDAPIPDEILLKFGQPDPEKIHFNITTSVGAGLNKDVPQDGAHPAYKHIQEDSPKNLPLYFDFERIPSEFLAVNVLLSSTAVPTELLPYLDVMSSIFSLPLVTEDGTEIPFEQVVKQLKKETVSTNMRLSYKSHLDEMVDVEIVVQREKYSNAVDWFYKLFYQTKFDETRIRVYLEKLVKGLPDLKRSGTDMLDSIFARTVFTERSTKKSTDFLFTENFWKEKLSLIENGKYSEIEAELETVRKALFEPSNMRILIVGEVENIKNPVSEWSKFLTLNTSTSLQEIPRSFNFLSDAGLKLEKKAYLIEAPGSESTYLHSVHRIPTDYLHADGPAISLAAAYLQAVEGPFWRGIRGTGLAYGANVYKEPEHGQLVFSIYRGADAQKAFEVAKTIVNDYSSGKTKIDRMSMNGAISSIVNGIANSESNYYTAAYYKFFDDALVKRGPEYNKFLLKNLRKLTEEDLLRVFTKYFVPLFESKTSTVFACVNPAKSSALRQNLEKVHGYEVSVEQLPNAEENGSGSEEDEDDESASDTDTDDDDETDSDSDSNSESESAAKI